MSFLERLHSKVSKKLDSLLSKYRLNRINNTDFTIICNNCWAGYVYRRYGLPYTTPFIGLYIFPYDYVKMCYNLEFYIKQPLKFISYQESAYRDIIEARNQKNVPIARLYDIEIIFLHYADANEAKEKWDRRVKRINFNNLIFKFSKMNYCTEEHLKQFDNLNVKKKFCFVPPEDVHLIDCSVAIPKSKNKKQIDDDTSCYSKYIDIEQLINSETVNGLNMTKAKNNE